MSHSFTHNPKSTFTMSDEDAQDMMRQPRRESQDEKPSALVPNCQMTSSASSRPNRKRKFKRR
jgi:hypothetical protein